MMVRIFLFCCISSVLITCNANTGEQNPQKAKQLYSDGMKMLEDRISIQSANHDSALKLNKMVIEKFSAAYKSDSTFTDAVLLASECTMFQKNYKDCIYWTTRLIQLDTSRKYTSFCIERIDYCKKHIAQ